MHQKKKGNKNPFEALTLYLACQFWAHHFKNLLYDENVGSTTNGSLISDETTTDYTLDAPIQGEEVIFSMEKQNSGKSAGPDGMGVEFYKSIKHKIAPTITHIFNIILNKGVILALWTESIICPVHKSGFLNDPSNHLDISLLNTMYKIMSSILTRRLYSWAEENNKIDEGQAGFGRGYSTTDNIFTLQSMVQKYLSRPGRRFYCIYVDFHKAFDKINHNALFNSLNKKVWVVSFIIFFCHVMETKNHV